MMTSMDKEKLAAFVDGELSPEEAAAVVLHLADHPEDQAYVDDLFAANEALQQVFAGPMHEPIPEAIRAAIMGAAATSEAVTSNVVAFPPRSRRTVLFGGLALAASVALATFFLPSLIAGPSSAGFALGPLPGSDPVVAVLDGRASGDALQLADGREAMVLATFEMPDGRYCREFEVIDRAADRIDIALGCRNATSWSVEAVIAEVIEVGTDQGFVPAGGAEADALAQYIERFGSPVLLDPAAEAAVIGQGWTR